MFYFTRNLCKGSTVYTNGCLVCQHSLLYKAFRPCTVDSLFEHTESFLIAELGHDFFLNKSKL